MGGGNPAMDYYPIHTETGISSGLMGHLTRMQTLPYCNVILNPNWSAKLGLIPDFLARSNYKCYSSFWIGFD